MVEQNATRALADAGMTAASDAVDPLIGRTLEGKYRIESLLGVGGMGRVYRGRNERTDSPVAIKTLNRDLTGDVSLVKRFEVEARSASNLRHPNTIRIYDFGNDQGVLFMVMELLSGRALEQVLSDEGALDQRRAVWIIMEACKSLAEAHANGLVHRDLKPDNLFLNRVGNSDQEHVKVLDFGVAKLRDKRFSDATLTQAGMIFGTPRYMSPEQARAQDLDGRSDIYALGIILFELLTGRPPFDAAEPIAILLKHVNEPPPAMADVAPGIQIDPALQDLVQRCMAKSPEQRPDSVEHLIAELEEIYMRVGGTEALRTLSSDRIVAPGQTLSDRAVHTPAGTSAPADPTLGVAPAAQSDHTFSMSGGGTGEWSVNDEERTRPRAGGPAIPMVLLGGLAVAVVVVAVLVGSMIMQRGSADPVAEESPVPTIAPAELAGAVQRAHATISTAERTARLTAQEATVVLELRAPEDVGARAWPEGREDLAVPLPHRFQMRRGEADEQRAFIIEAEGFQQARAELSIERSTVYNVRLEPEPRRPAARTEPRPSGGRLEPIRPGGPPPTVAPPTRPSRPGNVDIVDPYQ